MIRYVSYVCVWKIIIGRDINRSIYNYEYIDILRINHLRGHVLIIYSLRRSSQYASSKRKGIFDYFSIYQRANAARWYKVKRKEAYTARRIYSQISNLDVNNRYRNMRGANLIRLVGSWLITIWRGDMRFVAGDVDYVCMCWYSYIRVETYVDAWSRYRGVRVCVVYLYVIVTCIRIVSIENVRMSNDRVVYTCKAISTRPRMPRRRGNIVLSSPRSVIVNTSYTCASKRIESWNGVTNSSTLAHEYAAYTRTANFQRIGVSRY